MAKGHNGIEKSFQPLVQGYILAHSWVLSKEFSFTFTFTSIQEEYYQRSIYSFYASDLILLSPRRSPTSTLNNSATTQKKPTHVLQLPISRLDRLFCVLRLEIGDPFALPSKCLETLREDRVRVVVAGVHPVRIHGAQVLDLELEERFGELLGVPKLLGKVI